MILFLRRHPKTFFSILCIGLITGLLFACNIPTYDDSSYKNVNLIPDGKFTLISSAQASASPAPVGWTVDQDISSYPGNKYMDFSQVDTAPTVSGYADSTALYTGLPTSENIAGVPPPVYRLEFKNLFVPNDFENETVTPTYAGIIDRASDTAGAGIFSTSTGTNLGIMATHVRPDSGPDSSHPSIEIVDTGLPNINKALHIKSISSDWLDIDFSNTSVLSVPINTTTYTSYKFMFDLKMTGNTLFNIVWGNITNDSQRFRIELSKEQLETGNFVNFPKDTTDIAQNSVISSNTGENILRFNPSQKYNSEVMAPIDTLIDNFKVVDTVIAQHAAIRFQVPYALTDATTGTNIRPVLPQGGVYTLQFWVRAELKGVATKVLTVSVLNPGDGWGTKSYVTEPAAGAWANWTLVSVNFTNLLTNTIATGYPPTDPTTKLLEIAITPINNASDITILPGSILITSPKLTWASK